MPEKMAAVGTLFLVPVALGDDAAATLLAPATLDAARRLDTFIAENAKSARRFLKSIDHPRPVREIDIRVLDEHGGAPAVEAALALLLAGRHCGLMSEAGCPAVADPGAALVRRAHETGVRVVPLVGPSSILLALMASGMDGQHFAFHGYLPVDRMQRARRLTALDARAHLETQIFIETPYRNTAVLGAVLESARPDTLLCIAVDLTLATESAQTRRVSEWKERPPALDRRPAVFLLWRAGP